MFFVFHLLVIVFFCLSCSNNFILPNSTNYKSNKVKDALRYNKTFSTYKPFMEYLQNLTKTQKQKNLKQNVFDKMLSEEILSMKQHFHEKDRSYTPLIQSISQNHVTTPTLEVNQRWPIGKTITEQKKTIWKTKNNKINNLKNSSRDQDKEMELFYKERSKKLNDFENNNDGKDKIVGVRSTPKFSGVTRSVKCTCKPTISTTTCNSKKRENNRMCTHCEDSDNNVQVCTHSTTLTQKYENRVEVSTHSNVFTSESQYYAVPMPYYAAIIQNEPTPYEMSDSENENFYTMKRKYQMTTAVPEEVDMYYKNNEPSSDENDRDYLEEDRNLPNWKPPTMVKLETDCDELDYADRKNCLKRMKLENVRGDTLFEINDKDKLVDNLVNDIKRYHSDALVKDCYCSMYSNSGKSIANVLVFLYVFWLRFLLNPSP